MSAEAIVAVASQLASSSAVAGATGPAATASTGTSAGVRSGQDPVTATFDAMLDGLEALNSRMTAARAANESVVLGDLDNLHHIMLTAEQARLQFELVLTVRNKLLEAYQELMRQQV